MVYNLCTEHMHETAASGKGEKYNALAISRGRSLKSSNNCYYVKRTAIEDKYL